MALKYSKQRQAIWEFLQDRTDHPTADVVYNSVRKDYPSLSLGTVYRNLMLLRDIGKVRTVDVGDGIIHFDPEVREHNHFICSECGRILDIGGLDTDRIMADAATNFSGKIEGFTVNFHGICADCLKGKQKAPADDVASR